MAAKARKRRRDLEAAMRNREREERKDDTEDEFARRGKLVEVRKIKKG